MSNEKSPLLAGKVSKNTKLEAEEYPNNVRKNLLRAFSKFFMVS